MAKTISDEKIITIDPDTLPEGIVEAEQQFVDPFTLRSEYVDLIDSFISNQEEVLKAERPKASASFEKMSNYQYCIDTLKRLRNFVATWDLEVYPEEDV